MLVQPVDYLTHRRPLARRSVNRLLAVDKHDSTLVECSRITVAERTRREIVLKEERAERVAAVKHVIYALHLSRTDQLILSDASFVNLIQANHEGTTGANYSWSLPIEKLLAEEEKERLLLEEHQFDTNHALFEVVLPKSYEKAEALYSARHTINIHEQADRYQIAHEEEREYLELKFKRSVVRHTESVVTRLTREDSRVAAIQEKMSKLAYRSLEPRPLPNPCDHLSHQYQPDNDISVSSAQLPLGPHSPESHLHSLQVDTSFLETHILGLRALRVSEEEKLRDVQLQVQEADEELVEKLKILKDIEERIHQANEYQYAT